MFWIGAAALCIFETGVDALRAPLPNRLSSSALRPPCQVVNFLARISRSLSISPLLGGARGPYIRDEHRSIATAYFESPGTLDMKVCLPVISLCAGGKACRSRLGPV